MMTEADSTEYVQPEQDDIPFQTKSPYSELEYHFLLTQPGWGREATKELSEKVQLAKHALLTAQKNEKGEITIEKEALWGLLSYYTRDIRLGNLSSLNGEMEYCRFWLDTAGQCLRMNLIKSFLSALTKVITVLELSQSKGGFLRRRGNTVTKETYESKIEPKKNSIFGSKKQD